jgi:REP element-mobilizing transposase RayT
MTVVDWLPIFANPEIAEIILGSLRYIQKEKQVKLYAYVLMENHLHCIVQSENLSEAIKAFKSYTARTIIDYLIERKDNTLLKKLRHSKLRHKIESEYQLWREGSHPEEITSDEIMCQKIDYIHNNPVRRGYVEEPFHWRLIHGVGQTTTRL